MRFVVLFCLLAHSLAADLVPDVRAALRNNDFAAAESLIAGHRKQHGWTAENLVAMSWLGRGALAAKNYDAAERYAAETKQRSEALLKNRKLDDEKNLPLALGAAIEVEGHVLAARGARDQAVNYLLGELARYRETSIRTRIQKNINLIGLEGKPAPELEVGEWLGPRPQPLSAYAGRPVLLFFWAHWCGDCKAQSPIVGKIAQEFKPKGLIVIGPTQRYGYAERGREAGPEEELKHIESVRRQHYSTLLDVPAPVSEENFRNWGASTTPTLVLIDSKGIVRMYNPGRLSYEDLARRISELLPST